MTRLFRCSQNRGKQSCAIYSILQITQDLSCLRARKPSCAYIYTNAYLLDIALFENGFSLIVWQREIVFNAGNLQTGNAFTKVLLSAHKNDVITTGSDIMSSWRRKKKSLVIFFYDLLRCFQPVSKVTKYVFELLWRIFKVNL